MVNKNNIKDKSDEAVAIIGSGVSGLTTAFLLSKNHRVDLYEKNKYLGGHACTLKSKFKQINGNSSNFYYDIGFLVYNESNYPYFSRLLKLLNVRSEYSDMSFGVSDRFSSFEYGSRGLLAFTDNFKNLFLKNFWKMIIDILRFNSISRNIILKNNCNSTTVLNFLSKNNFSKTFVFKYFIPMCSAIWSTPEKNVLKMPILSILLFLNNHGLLNLINRPKWRTITNGSHNYVKKIIKNINGSVYKNKKVVKVTRFKRFCLVEGNNFKKKYQKVVFANHSDDILKILRNPSKKEKNFFSRSSYTSNSIYVHKDIRLMPNNKKAWSSWNVLLNNETESALTSVTYWINRLQNINIKENIFVTLNPSRQSLPEKNKVIKILNMKHPVIKKNTRTTEIKLNSLQGKDKIYYAGAWSGYGFHEDGVKSAINVAKLFGIDFNEFF